jgi:hypothetical protein
MIIKRLIAMARDVLELALERVCCPVAAGTAPPTVHRVHRELLLQKG